MIKARYCRYYRLQCPRPDGPRRILLSEDEIIAGPTPAYNDTLGGFWIKTASGYSYRVTSPFPEKVEQEALPPLASEIHRGEANYYFNRTYSVVDPNYAE